MAGLQVDGDPASVRFTVRAGGVGVRVDWDTTEALGYSLADLQGSGLDRLVRGVADAAAVCCGGPCAVARTPSIPFRKQVP